MARNGWMKYRDGEESNLGFKALVTHRSIPSEGESRLTYERLLEAAPRLEDAEITVWGPKILSEEAYAVMERLEDLEASA